MKAALPLVSHLELSAETLHAMLAEYLLSKGYAMVSPVESFELAGPLIIKVTPATDADYAAMELQQPPDVAKDTLALVQMLLEQVSQLQDLVVARQEPSPRVRRTDVDTQISERMVKDTVLPLYPTGVSKHLIESYVDEGVQPFVITELKDLEGGSPTPPNRGRSMVESRGIALEDLDDDVDDLFD